ncbi:S8 family serine peptidase [Streptomyces sp. NPDC046821]|uniref:S8 family peptidase n=1 Tax=Streptomyces sp. NPDC046821 TaxID=3154702 RepID=UPI0033E3A8AC
MLAALLVGAAMPATAAGDVPPDGAKGPVFTDPGARATPTGRHTVTLLTGDVVTYSGKGDSLQIDRIVPGEGREGMGFTRHHVDGHEYAVPIDAAEQIASGRVDQRLFDVTELAADGYNDQDASTLRLVVGDAPSVAGGPRAPEHARVADRFDIAKSAVLSVPKKETGAVWRQLATASAAARSAGIGKVWLDGRVKASLDESVPQIGADEAHKRGVTGKGVKVAVLDTGYDKGHPDLKGRVVAEQDFTGDGGGVQDEQGHGTHVSSTVAGTGAASGGRYAGVAPGADLIEGQVLDYSGSGYDSWILAGMEWAAAQGADIVSMSLGGSQASDGTDAMSAAVDRISREHGTLFVIAAGNTGDQTIGSPGAADEALTVGSVTKSGELSSFSSRGPRQGRWAVKPEIAAPGSDIVAARAAGTLADAAVNSSYASLSGTSMATPHVAGAAALLKQKHPDWTGQQLKAALVGTASEVKGTTVDQTGGGLTDVPAAMDASVTATPSTLAARASGSDESREITWTNTTAKPVTLQLSAQGDVVKTGQATVTVPANGTATSTVKLALAQVGPGASTGGRVIADWPGKGSVSVPVSVTSAEETGVLTLTGPAPRAGAQQTSTTVVLQNEKTGDSWLTGVNNTTSRKLTIPRGSYRLLVTTWEYNTVGYTTVGETAIHSVRRVTVGENASVQLSTDGAKPVRMGVDDAGARITTAGGTGLVSSVGGGDTGLIATSAAGPYEVQVVPTPEGQNYDGLTMFGTTSWQQREIDAHEPGGTPQDLGLQLSQYSIYRWTGSVTGKVVDIGGGTDAELEGKDLKGAIVLWKATSVWGDKNDPIYKKLTDAGVSLILYRGYGISVYKPTPIAQVSDESMPLLKDRLAKGPLTLTVEGVDTSPTAYFLFHKTDGALPAGADWYDRKADLARIHTIERTHGYPGDPKDLYAWTSSHGLRLAQQTTRYRVPAEQDVYVTPGVPWTTATFHYQYDVHDRVFPLGTQLTAPTVYSADRAYSDDWMSAPFNPAIGDSNVVRDGDKLRVSLPVFSDAAGHQSDYAPEADTGTTVLASDDGTVIDKNDSPGKAVFDLPRADRWYRLTVDAQRDGGDPVTWMLGTRVTSEWRLRSEHVAHATPAKLLDLDYDLPLSGTNSVDEDKALTYTVGAAKGTAPLASLKVSYATDGTTWHQADAVRGADGRWKVTVPAAGTAKVSLKTTATDATGAALTETLTDAYNSGCPDMWCGWED